VEGKFKNTGKQKMNLKHYLEEKKQIKMESEPQAQ
jgi:hypothetical protein